MALFFVIYYTADIVLAINLAIYNHLVVLSKHIYTTCTPTQVRMHSAAALFSMFIKCAVFANTASIVSVTNLVLIKIVCY